MLLFCTHDILLRQIGQFSITSALGTRLEVLKDQPQAAHRRAGKLDTLTRHFLTKLTKTGFLKFLKTAFIVV